VSNSELFILAGDPDLVRALIRIATTDPSLQLVSVSGPPDAPERIVVRMPVERAELMLRALGGQLVVEPDEPVDPVG
jgi:hypothetical protein